MSKDRLIIQSKGYWSIDSHRIRGLVASVDRAYQTASADGSSAIDIDNMYVQLRCNGKKYVLSSVHTGDYSRRIRQRQSPTVAKFGDKLSSPATIVAEIGDYGRHCGQGLIGLSFCYGTASGE